MDHAYSRYYSLRLIRAKLDYVNELRMIAKSIIEEYPFTKQFFQDGLKEIVSKLKSELSSLEKLKKRFNLIPFCSF